MFYFKKIFTLLLTLTLIIATVGCGNSKKVSTELADAKDDSPYPNPEKKVKFSLFADCSWLPYDNLDGITGQEIERLTGVSFDLVKSTDSEQLTLLMSSGDLPDMVMTGSSSKQNKLSTADLCYSYNELIEKYAPDWDIPEIEKNINSYYSEDGNFYMLKNEFNTIDEIKNCETVGPNFGQMHMRKDIYEALGSPSMKNKEEFYEVLDKVKEKYPDMVPIVVNMRAIGSIAAQLVGMDLGMPKDENGDYCYALSDPKYHELMATFNEMCRKGYMLKENFTYTTDEQVFEFASKGNAFVITHYAGNDDQMLTGRVKALDPNASFVQVPLMDEWAYTLGVSGWSGLFITKNCKDPETAVKIIRWAKEPQNQITTMVGVEGEDWERTDDGGFKPLPRLTKAIEDGKKDTLYTPVSFLITATDYIRESINFYANATPATKQIFKDAVQRANWSNVVDLCYPKSETDERVILNKLGDLSDEYMCKLGIAESEEEFEQLYKEMMDIAEEIGIEKVDNYLATTYKELCEKLNAK